MLLVARPKVATRVVFPVNFHLVHGNRGVAEIFQRLYTAGIINPEPREKNKKEDPTHDAARVSMHSDRMVILLSVRYSPESSIKISRQRRSWLIPAQVGYPLIFHAQRPKQRGGSSSGFTTHKLGQGRSSSPPGRGAGRKG